MSLACNGLSLRIVDGQGLPASHHPTPEIAPWDKTRLNRLLRQPKGVLRAPGVNPIT